MKTSFLRSLQNQILALTSSRSSHRRRRLKCVSTEQLETRQMLAAVVELVNDFEQAPAGVFPSYESVQLNDNVVLFSMSSLETGSGIWRSDGTASGTFKLTEAKFEIASPLTKVGDIFYFTSFVPYGRTELWKTDGTVAGTKRVADLSADVDTNSIRNLVASGDSLLYFSAVNDIWRSDGTANGTFKVMSMSEYSYIYHMMLGSDATGPNALYVKTSVYSPGIDVTQELWRCDLNVNTQQMVYSKGAFNDMSLLSFYDGRFLFGGYDAAHGTELWSTEGTPETTSLWLDIKPGSESSFPGPPVVIGSSAYFRASSSSNRSELWVIQDSDTGPQPVIDINSGRATSSPGPLDIVVAGEKYMNNGSGIRQINGAQSFPVLTTEAIQNSSGSLFGSGDRLYYYSESLKYAVAGQITNTDVQFRRIETFIGTIGSNVLFFADDRVHGTELWITDGTMEGTALVVDIATGTAGFLLSNLSNTAGNLTFIGETYASGSSQRILLQADESNVITQIDELPSFDHQLYSLPAVGNSFEYSKFISDQSGTGFQVFSWDGVQRKTIVRLPEGVVPAAPTFAFNGVTVLRTFDFNAVDSPHEFWTVDDSGNRKELLGAFRSISAYEPQREFGHAYFWTESGIWRTDGSPAGSHLLSLSPDALVVWRLRYARNYIFAVDESTRGLAFLNRGTDELKTVKDIFTPDAYPTGAYSMSLLGDLPTKTLFVVNSNRIWQTSGTEESTSLAFELQNSHVMLQPLPATLGDVSYFIAIEDDVEGGISLWRTDGTGAGTSMVSRISDSGDEAVAGVLSAVDNKLFFAVHNDITGYSNIWTSDGTPEGTLPIRTDLTIDNSARFMAYDGGIGFAAASPAVGNELFRIDTTIAVSPPSEITLADRLATETVMRDTDIAWADVAGAIQFDVWIQNLTHPSMPPVRKRVNEPRFSVLGSNVSEDNLNPNYAYRVWVRSLPVLGNPSAWSAAKDFTLGPDPVMHSVQAFNVNAKPVFNWAGPADVVSYEIWLTNRDTKTRTLYEKNLTSTTFAVTESLAPAKYAVWVRGTRSDGSLTAWSTVSEFVVLTPPVTLTAGVGDQRSPRPTFAWSGVNGATGYDVRVFLPDGKTLVYSANSVIGLSHTPTQDLPAGKFVVNVRAVKNSQPLSAWGSGTALWMKLPPENLRTTATGFAWDAVPFAGSYTFELRGTSGALYLPRKTQTGTTIELPTPLPPGKYTLRVFASYPKPSSNWTETFSTEVFRSPVTITSSTAPTVDATPTISWTAATGASSYEVLVTKPGSSVPIYTRTGITGTSHRIDVPLAAGISQIQVRAIFPDGSRSSLSTVQSLTIGIGTPVTFSGGALSWNSVNGATNYELWINYLGTPNRRQIVYDSMYLKTSYKLPSTLPKGRYQTWLRPVRAESGQLYYGAWTSVLFDIV